MKGKESPHSITENTEANGDTNAGHDDHHVETKDKIKIIVTNDAKSEKTDTQNQERLYQ